MKLTDVISNESIIVKFAGHGKDEVFRAMIASMAASGKITDADEVYRVVMEREKIMSTGIGKGFALPHGKTNAVTDTIGALATLDTPIDFNALDNRPVNVVFMLIGRENAVGVHLRLLSRISRMMNDDMFRKKILDATSAAEVLLLFDHQENELG